MPLLADRFAYRLAERNAVAAKCDALDASITRASRSVLQKPHLTPADSGERTTRAFALGAAA